MKRRRLFQCCLAGLAAGSPVLASENKRPRLLLRPGTFQIGNIGDIAHSPGALNLLRERWPEAEVTLWPRGLSPEARASLERNFPELRIVEGGLDATGKPDNEALARAWAEADLLLHGSAPGFKGGEYLPAWRSSGSKPYGLFGITLDPLSGINRERPKGATLAQFREAIGKLPKTHLHKGTRTLLDGAAFVFCRDGLTLEYLKQQGVGSPLAFGPDSTFSLNLRDEARAEAYLQETGLKAGDFLCVIPRLRYTPSEVEGVPETKGLKEKAAVNARTRAADHALLRAAMERWVRETGRPVLACPEMSYEVELAKVELVDPLPPEIRKHVVWRDRYWQPDEAASIYARAAAVLSFECHSPIIALAAGTPALYIRQPTDTVKGQMYHDLGAGDWTGEVEEVTAEQLGDRLLEIHARPQVAHARAEAIRGRAHEAQVRMVAAARRAVASA